MIGNKRQLFLSIHAFEAAKVIPDDCLICFNYTPEHFEKLDEAHKKAIYCASSQGRAIVQTTQFPLKVSDINFLLAKNYLLPDDDKATFDPKMIAVTVQHYLDPIL